MNKDGKEQVRRKEVIRQLGEHIQRLGVYNTMLVRVGRAESGHVQAQIAFPAIKDWSVAITHSKITMPEGEVTTEGSMAVRQMVTGMLNESLGLEKQGLRLEVAKLLGGDLKRMPYPPSVEGMSAIMIGTGPPAEAYLVLIEPLDHFHQMPNFF